MAPKVECPHTPSCHAGGTCRAKRSRESKKKAEEEEEEKKARRRKSNTDRMRESRELNSEFVSMTLDFDEPDPFDLIKVLKDENEKLKQELACVQGKLAAARRENASLKERIRRRDQKLEEAEKVNVGKVGGEWPVVVKVLAMSLRSVGVGAATTGRLLGFIFFVLLGQNIGEIPRQTIRDWDEVAGDLMVLMVLNAVARRGVQHLSWMQDTASGARHSYGWSATVLALCMKHPSKPGKVLPVIVDAKIGMRGLAKLKAEQINIAQQKLLTPRSLPAPLTLVGDHANDQAAVAPMIIGASTFYCPCHSHKLAKACEAGTDYLFREYDKCKDGKEVMKSNMSALLTALDASRTRSTTSSGLLCRAYIFGESDPFEGLCGLREAGHRFGFHMEVGFKVLGSRSVLSRAVSNGDLTIPGSRALFNLVECSETFVFLTILSLGFLLLKKAFDLLKGNGEVSYRIGMESATKITRLMEDFLNVKSIDGLPEWARCDTFERSREFIIREKKRALFKRLFEGFSKGLYGKWLFMLSLHQLPEKDGPSTAALDATPSTNDAVEGFIGYIATLGAKLGSACHPQRLTSLAMFAYNRNVLLQLCDTIVFTDSDYKAARKCCTWEDYKSLCLRVHKTMSIVSEERRREVEMNAEASRTVYKTTFGEGRTVPGTHTERIRAIVEHEYTQKTPVGSL